MAYRNEAYDFSLFEEHVDNTAPVLDPKVQEQPRHNVVELPEQPKQPGQRPRRQPKPKRCAERGSADRTYRGDQSNAKHAC